MHSFDAQLPENPTADPPASPVHPRVCHRFNTLCFAVLCPTNAFTTRRLIAHMYSVKSSFFLGPARNDGLSSVRGHRAILSPDGRLRIYITKTEKREEKWFSLS